MSSTARTRRRLSPASLVLLVIALAIALVGNAWVSGSLTAPAGTAGTATSAPVADESSSSAGMSGIVAIDETALELLESIPIKGKSPRTGYDREGKFGSAWKDVDGNGCDTRNDTLARDLVDLVLSGDCRVMNGTLEEPYEGLTILFQRGEATSSLVQIDHVVALSNAWQTGAQKIGQARREALANDPLNLLAVDGPTNSSKGDGDTATWLPPSKAFRCEYVARQVSVKAEYDLWVTRAEREAMVRVLSACNDQPAFAVAE